MLNISCRTRSSDKNVTFQIMILFPFLSLLHHCLSLPMNQLTMDTAEVRINISTHDNENNNDDDDDDGGDSAISFCFQVQSLKSYCFNPFWFLQLFLLPPTFLQCKHRAASSFWLKSEEVASPDMITSHINNNLLILLISQLNYQPPFTSEKKLQSAL